MPHPATRLLLAAALVALAIAVLEASSRSGTTPARPPHDAASAAMEPRPAEPGAAPAPGGAGAPSLSLLPKYAGQRWSDVPHDVVVAFDERADAVEGRERAIVAVVSPAATDTELERLLRDLWGRHREAEVLRVRVLDSRDSLRAPPAAGVTHRDPHRVAELTLDAGRVVLAVRGRSVAP